MCLEAPCSTAPQNPTLVLAAEPTDVPVPLKVPSYGAAVGQACPHACGILRTQEESEQEEKGGVPEIS